jgi:hypothetical protein
MGFIFGRIDNCTAIEKAFHICRYLAVKACDKNQVTTQPATPHTQTTLFPK